MIRYYGVVEGRVQGVGFRFFCQLNAKTFNLTGFVRNLDNGMVEFQIQGTEDNLNAFLTRIKKGNLFIKVENVSIKKISTVQNESSFNIIH